MPSSLDHVLESVKDAVRVQLEARRKEAVERIAAVQAAVDGYIAAIEREAMAEILRRVGAAAAEEGQTARQAAVALRTAVEQLPELTANKPRRPPKPPRPPETEPLSARASESSPGALTTRLPIPTTLQTRAKGGTAPPAPRRTYRALLAAAKKRRIVIVGGLQKGDKLQALAHSLGFSPEWIETEGAASNAIRSLEGRILDGRIAALVVLEGVMSHTHVEPLVRATRQTGTPFAYADRGGKASIERAFDELEAALDD